MKQVKRDWRHRCQKCSKIKESTRPRAVYTKHYSGSCGDSFCYASCELSACRPITGVVCDDCEKEIQK